MAVNRYSLRSYVFKKYSFICLEGEKEFIASYDSIELLTFSVIEAACKCYSLSSAFVQVTLNQGFERIL